MRREASFILILALLVKFSLGQADSANKSTDYKKRRIALASSSILLTGGSLVYLDQAWYSDYKTGNFHFFNDNKEWLQMDKVGHMFTTYQTSRLMMQAFDWAGYSRRWKLIAGGGLGLAYMTAIECMDGFSRGWGFSWGDEVADILGTAAGISQELAWKEQRIQLKFSFSRSGLAQYNPSLLGKSLSTEVLKDYNGQTYWLSINPSSFMRKETRFPKWLNIAVGYGAYGMLGGYYNDVVAIDASGEVLKMDRERRFFLSLDLDLTRIRTRSKFLKTLFSIVNILKIPAPTLQFSGKGVHAYAFYY